MKNTDEKSYKPTGNLRRLVLCIGLPIFVMAISTAIMYSEKQKWLEEQQNTTEATDKGMEATSTIAEADYVTYKYKGEEYDISELLEVADESTSITVVIYYKDGSTLEQEAYLSFSPDIDEPTATYEDGEITIILPQKKGSGIIAR